MRLLGPRALLPSGPIHDEAGATLMREVVPHPRERHDSSVAQADQEVDMRHAPEHPADEAFQVHMIELHHSRLAPDRGKVPMMPVAEWTGYAPP